MHRSTPIRALARGVFEAPYRSTADEPILLAIDHRGRRLAERVVSRTADVESAWAGLEAFLDREDPPVRRAIRLMGRAS